MSQRIRRQMADGSDVSPETEPRRISPPPLPVDLPIGCARWGGFSCLPGVFRARVSPAPGQPGSSTSIKRNLTESRSAENATLGPPQTSPGGEGHAASACIPGRYGRGFGWAVGPRWRPETDGGQRERRPRTDRQWPTEVGRQPSGYWSQRRRAGAVVALPQPPARCAGAAVRFGMARSPEPRTLPRGSVARRGPRRLERRQRTPRRRLLRVWRRSLVVFSHPAAPTLPSNLPLFLSFGPFEGLPPDPLFPGDLLFPDRVLQKPRHAWGCWDSAARRERTCGASSLAWRQMLIISPVRSGIRPPRTHAHESCFRHRRVCETFPRVHRRDDIRIGRHHMIWPQLKLGSHECTSEPRTATGGQRHTSPASADLLTSPFDARAASRAAFTV